MLFNIVRKYYKTAVSFAKYCIEVQNETLGDFTTEEHDDINKELKNSTKDKDTLSLMQATPVHLTASNP